MIEVREYPDYQGRSPFAEWFNDLDGRAAANVTTSITRIAQGNRSNLKGVGSGVFECRIDFGPGYRIYSGRSAERLVILLAGGTKKRQQKDTSNAKARWQDYKQRKKK